MNDDRFFCRFSSACILGQMKVRELMFLFDGNAIHLSHNYTGEGGTFALLQGLYPKHENDASLGEGENTPLRGRRWLNKFQWPLQIWSLFGTALTLSDGIFTPGSYRENTDLCGYLQLILSSSRFCHQRRWRYSCSETRNRFGHYTYLNC